MVHPAIGTRVSVDGLQGVVVGHRPQGMVDIRVEGEDFIARKRASALRLLNPQRGGPSARVRREVEKMLHDSKMPEEEPTVRMEFAPGDSVTIKEGPFENYEGTVDEVLPERGLVRVLVTIFGRQAPVELEYWQIAKAEE